MVGVLPQMKEIWKDIKGFEGIFQISNLGNVKSLARYVGDYRGKRLKKERILKPCDNGYGYLVLKVNTNNGKGKPKVFYIHRLVAEHFIPNPLNKKYVNHLDFNKYNNVFTNLEWCSQKENVNYSIERMEKPKSFCRKTNTGEKYIRIKYGKYLFSYVTKKTKKYKMFNDLKSAIEYRDNFLEGELYGT